MPRNFRAQRDERKRDTQFRKYLETFTFRFCCYNIDPFNICNVFLVRHILYYLYIEVCIAYGQVPLVWLWPMRFFVLLLYINYVIGYYWWKPNFLLYPIVFFAVTCFLSVGMVIPHVLSFFFPSHFQKSDFINCCPFGFLDILAVSIFCRGLWMVFAEYRAFLLNRPVWEKFLPRDIHIPG